MTTPAREDQTIRCQDCGSFFTHSVSEQAWFDQRGYDRPKRCGPCREAKRAARAAAFRQPRA